MKDKNIKPGFLLKITTWENDADAYNTVELPGLGEDEVKFFIEVAKLFYSRHSHLEKGFGNSERGMDEVGPSIDEIVAKFKAEGLTVPKDWDKEQYEDKVWLERYEEDFYSDYLYDLIGSWNDGYYWRVFDDFQVFHVPSALENVTHKFKG